MRASCSWLEIPRGQSYDPASEGVYGGGEAGVALASHSVDWLHLISAYADPNGDPPDRHSQSDNHGNPASCWGTCGHP